MTWFLLPPWAWASCRASWQCPPCVAPGPWSEDGYQSQISGGYLLLILVNLATASGSNMRRKQRMRRKFLRPLSKFFLSPIRRCVHRQQANQMPGHLNVRRLVGVNLFVVCQSLGRAHLSGGGLLLQRICCKNNDKVCWSHTTLCSNQEKSNSK